MKNLQSHTPPSKTNSLFLTAVLHICCACTYAVHVQPNWPSQHINDSFKMTISQEFILDQEHTYCEPFVLGPALAMDRIPGPVCLTALDVTHNRQPLHQKVLSIVNNQPAAWYWKLTLEVFIWEGPAIDWFSPSAVSCCKVSTCTNSHNSHTYFVVTCTFYKHKGMHKVSGQGQTCCKGKKILPRDVS